VSIWATDVGFLPESLFCSIKLYGATVPVVVLLAVKAVCSFLSSLLDSCFFGSGFETVTGAAGAASFFSCGGLGADSSFF